MEDEDKCCICLEKLSLLDTEDVVQNVENIETVQNVQNVQNETKTLPCGHKFHDECINHWFRLSSINRCPMCRMPTTPSNGNENVEMNADYDYQINDFLSAYNRDEENETEPVFFYNTPLGVIMIRTINTPRRMRLVAYPIPSSTTLRLRPRTSRRRFFSQNVWRRFKNHSTRLWRVFVTFIRCGR